ncbi:MAG TPA: GDSL-type esterase/lipase family protein [Sphingomonas sp.]|jgi:lysophospholipase L1-like esterase|uniref:GDSL-type esterase/lipase family protein n=1 Tax=Sphingomonas sp. TaxID=28214 RepID=UPI002ED8287B
MKRAPLLLCTLALAATVSVRAAEPTPEQRAQWAKEGEERLHTDWAWLGRYKAANATLPPPVKGQPRIVLLGDSITQGWYDMVPGFFTPGRIGRGIGGQTTPQMLVRFPADVIALKPAVVQIMAGTNDIAFNTGPMTPYETRANIRAMTELAQANGIRVILASIPPADQFPWRPGLQTADKIVAMNGWLRAYAAATGSTYADYWTALKGDGLGMREGLSSDHVHPTVAGYAVMAPVAERAFKAALAKPAPTRAVIAR